VPVVVLFVLLLTYDSNAIKREPKTMFYSNKDAFSGKKYTRALAEKEREEERKEGRKEGRKEIN
jgi:hypothetical protein